MPSRHGTVLLVLPGVLFTASCISWVQLPSFRASTSGRSATHRTCVAAGSNSLVAKLRQKKSAKPLPKLESASGSGPTVPVSSAFPPGSTAPPLRSRVHKILEERPELLEAAKTAVDLSYLPMTAKDAQDLADLQTEFYPAASYPDDASWCESLITHPGVLALKACLPGEGEEVPVGIVIALASRDAIENFTDVWTVDVVRKELTMPHFIPWDNPDRRELAYVLSVGTVGEMRRRGVAAELLQRALRELKAREPDLRAVALDLAAYNTAAIRCYEALGFKRLRERPDAYAGNGRRSYSALFYALFTS